MIYRPGERIAFVATNDPHLPLRPGEQGTVRRHDPQLQTVDIDWDNGRTLCMVLDAGDRIRRITEAAPTPLDDDPDGADDQVWQQVLATVRSAGAEAGRNAAEWWAQDSIGGRAGGDVAATARRILAGIDDGDPAVLQTLPSLHSTDDRNTDADTDAVVPSWPMVAGPRRDEVDDAYRDGFDTAVEDEIAARCRAVTETQIHAANHDHDSTATRRDGPPINDLHPGCPPPTTAPNADSVSPAAPPTQPAQTNRNSALPPTERDPSRNPEHPL